MYLTYNALGEFQDGGAPSGHQGIQRGPPERALEGFGICLKVWDFGVI